MIDLAPHNPYSQPLRSPVLVAAGCAVRDLDLGQVGGVLTRPVTVHTRDLPAPTWAATPAGIVYSHLPSISVRTLLRDEARRWPRSAAPVWIALTGTADELAECADRLQGVEDVAGLVITVEDDDIARAVRAVRQSWMLPLLTALVLGPQCVAQARAAAQHGADALVVAVPPPAVAGSTAALVSGVLLGPAVVPQVLGVLVAVRAAVDVPLVAQGGIADATLARAYLAAGASALLVDAARWGDPLAPARIAAALDAAPPA